MQKCSIKKCYEEATDSNVEVPLCNDHQELLLAQFKTPPKPATIGNILTSWMRGEPPPPEVVGQYVDRMANNLQNFQQKYQRPGAQAEPRRRVLTPSQTALKILQFDFTKPAPDKKQIKDRYHKLARVFHSDVEGGDAKKMTELNQAYEILMKS